MFLTGSKTSILSFHSPFWSYPHWKILYSNHWLNRSCEKFKLIFRWFGLEVLPAVLNKKTLQGWVIADFFVDKNIQTGTDVESWNMWLESWGEEYPNILRIHTYIYIYIFINIPWEPTTFIFRDYKPYIYIYIGGLKPSFFMVLGSKGRHYIHIKHYIY